VRVATVWGRHTVDLSWSGASSPNVDIYRNGAFITNTPNDGFYTDSPGTRGHATYTYKVCEAGTQTCSNQVTVTF
jgi:serine protease